jgi:hypothetical protein
LTFEQRRVRFTLQRTHAFGLWTGLWLVAAQISMAAIYGQGRKAEEARRRNARGDLGGSEGPHELVAKSQRLPLPQAARQNTAEPTTVLSSFGTTAFQIETIWRILFQQRAQPLNQ